MRPQKSPSEHGEKPICRLNSPAVGLFRRFFKVVLQTFIEHKKLRVPLKFANHYGNELSDVAQFIISDGRVWKVEIKKEGEHIWFENGFYEFVKHYSISHGSLLNFKYKGMSNFSVNILDNSGCEIQYPPYKPTIHREDPVESFGSPVYASTSKRKFSSHLKNPKIVSSATKKNFEPENIGKRCKVQEVVDVSDDEEASLDNGTDNSDSGQESDVFVASNFNEVVSKLSPESKRAVNEARKYKPKSHAFMVIIRADNIRDLRKLDVPAAFANKYRHRITGDMIRVQISDEEQWQSEFAIRLKWRIGGDLVLTEGWSSFVNSNNLEIGAVCVFEVMNSDKFMLKAIIFRASLE